MKTISLAIILLILLFLAVSAVPAIAAWGAVAVQSVGVRSDGAQANGGSGFSHVSAGGHYVAFESSASNLVIGDTNATGDAFVAELSAPPPVDLTNIDCAPDLFNPTTGGSTTCSFTLNRTAWAVLIVLDTSYNLRYVSPFDPAGSQYGAGVHSIAWAGQLAALADGPYILIVYAADADGNSDFAFDPALYVNADNGQNPVVSNLDVGLSASPGTSATPYTIAFDIDKYHTPMMGIVNGKHEWVRVLIGKKAYAGHSSFLWDGKDAAGNPAPPDTYWFLGIAQDEYGRVAGCYTNVPGQGAVGCINFTAGSGGRAPSVDGDVPAPVREALARLAQASPNQ